MKESKCGILDYGCSFYNYEEGTFVFPAPGQVYGMEDINPKRGAVGKTVIFYPDVIDSTSLGKKGRNSAFFHAM